MSDDPFAPVRCGHKSKMSRLNPAVDCPEEILATYRSYNHSHLHAGRRPPCQSLLVRG